MKPLINLLHIPLIVSSLALRLDLTYSSGLRTPSVWFTDVKSRPLV